MKLVRLDRNPVEQTTRLLVRLSFEKNGTRLAIDLNLNEMKTKVEKQTSFQIKETYL